MVRLREYVWQKNDWVEICDYRNIYASLDGFFRQFETSKSCERYETIYDKDIIKGYVFYCNVCEGRLNGKRLKVIIEDEL